MKFTSNVIFWLIAVVFFSAALFFTVQIQKIKSTLNKPSSDIQITSGQKVKVTKIIDGDEILIKLNDTDLTVRILGIMSFDPSVNDPLMENIAKSSFHYLEKMILNQEIELVFEKFQKDPNSRVLSYVFLNQSDIGLELVQNGFSLVYSKYPFPKIEAYLSAERSARKNKKGIWLVPAASQRADQLHRLWESQQRNEGAKP